MSLGKFYLELKIVSQVCVPNFRPVAPSLLWKIRWGFFLFLFFLLLLFGKVKSTSSPRPKSGVWQHWFLVVLDNGIDQQNFRGSLKKRQKVYCNVTALCTNLTMEANIKKRLFWSSSSPWMWILPWRELLRNVRNIKKYSQQLSLENSSDCS